MFHSFQNNFKRQLISVKSKQPFVVWLTSDTASLLSPLPLTKASETLLPCLRDLHSLASLIKRAKFIIQGTHTITKSLH